MTDVTHPNHKVFVKLPFGKRVRSVCIEMQTECLIKRICRCYVCVSTKLVVPAQQRELIQVMPPIDLMRHSCFFHICLLHRRNKSSDKQNKRQHQLLQSITLQKQHCLALQLIPINTTWNNTNHCSLLLDERLSHPRKAIFTVKKYDST